MRSLISRDVKRTNLYQHLSFMHKRNSKQTSKFVFRYITKIFPKIHTQISLGRPTIWKNFKSEEKREKQLF